MMDNRGLAFVLLVRIFRYFYYQFKLALKLPWSPLTETQCVAYFTRQTSSEHCLLECPDSRIYPCQTRTLEVIVTNSFRV